MKTQENSPLQLNSPRFFKNDDDCIQCGRPKTATQGTTHNGWCGYCVNNRMQGRGYDSYGRPFTAPVEATFTRSKGGTAEREEIISQIQVPDLWELYIALKDGNLTRSKQVQARWADTVLETWHLAHDLRKHLQSNS
jgi:hypothetical protein